jgi:hypothetical protein
MTVEEMIELLQGLPPEAQKATIVTEEYADSESSVPFQKELSEPSFYKAGSYPKTGPLVIV